MRGNGVLELARAPMQIVSALTDCGLGGEVMANLLGVVAALIHLGNVEVPQPAEACACCDTPFVNSLNPNLATMRAKSSSRT